jgi:TolA-binding protein
MLKPQRKMKKKEIKEDKFVKFTLEAKSYVEENAKQVMTIAGGIIALILMIMFYVYVHNGTVTDATTLYGKATLEYQAMNYSKAKGFLEKLVEEYDGTDAADRGKFLLGNIYYKEKNIADAKKYFQDFVDSYSDSDILLASGYAGLASCYAFEKDYGSAAEYYEKAYKAIGKLPEGANFLYLAGLNYRKAGDFENAKEAFRKVSEEYKNSERSFDAKEELILLAKK